jgi:hypothetical protein
VLATTAEEMYDHSFGKYNQYNSKHILLKGAPKTDVSVSKDGNPDMV